MRLTNNTQPVSVAEEHEVYTFVREEGWWYIHLPDGLDREWNKQNLRMADGAHKFLNVLSKGTNTLRLRIGTAQWTGADSLAIIEYCEAPKGGGLYLFTPAAKPQQASIFWICDLVLFIFGDVPEQFFVQRLPLQTTTDNIGTQDDRLPVANQQ